MNGYKLSLLIAILVSFASVKGQESDSTSIAKRIFMPSVQMGYIENQSSQLAGGLFIQTSIEYKTRKGIFFRLNYDDFDADYEIETAEGSLTFIGGKVSFSELIGGIGYRFTAKKHNVLLAVQPGLRFYGFPTVQTVGTNINVELDKRNIPIARYSLGYEYEVEPRAFLALELFGSHVWEEIDFWKEDKAAFGFTLGITTTIF